MESEQSTNELLDNSGDVDEFIESLPEVELAELELYPLEATASTRLPAMKSSSAS